MIQLFSFVSFLILSLLFLKEQDDSHGSNISLYSECEMRGDYPITGRLRVRLEYRKGNLRVHILNAEELAAADSNGFSDPYVKMYLLPDKSKQSKRKTDVKLKTLNPVFNETMQVWGEFRNMVNKFRCSWDHITKGVVLLCI